MQSPFVVPEAIHEIQSGSLFYLELVPGPVTVSTGKSILLPMDWAVSWMPEDRDMLRSLAASKGLDPDSLTDEDLLRLFVNDSADNYKEMYCRINGRPLQNLEQYRYETPAFDFVYGGGWWDDTLFPPGPKGPTMAAGHAVILAPLPPGEYFIERGGVWWGTDVYHFETRLIVR